MEDAEKTIEEQKLNVPDMSFYEQVEMHFNNPNYLQKILQYPHFSMEGFKEDLSITILIPTRVKE